MKRIGILVFLISIATAFATAQNYSRLLMLKKSRMNGEDVRAVQNALNKLGFVEAGEADGWFGPKTEQAVKNFQKLTGFSVNGVVNKDVYDVLVYGKDGGKAGNVMKSYLDALYKVNAAKDLPLAKKESVYTSLSSEEAEICVYANGNKNVLATMSLPRPTGNLFASLYRVGENSAVLVCESKKGAQAENATYSVYYCHANLYLNIANGQAVDTAENVDNIGHIGNIVAYMASQM